jgi:hypothetical protein
MLPAQQRKQAMPRLSKRTVDALQPSEKDYFAWDEDLHGFGLRVWPSGRKVYLIQYRDSGGRTRRKSLGKHGVVTAEDARGNARDMLAGVAHGQNPSEEARRKRVAPTVEELCDRFMADYVPSRCKASTQKEYRRNIDLFIKPKLARLKVADVERSDIADLHHLHRNIPYQANRTLGVLSVMFTQAEVWGLRPEGSNPCRHVKKYEEKKRERYLSPEELARLGQTLTELEASGEEPLPAINAIRLLILTGCRLGRNPNPQMGIRARKTACACLTLRQGQRQCTSDLAHLRCFPASSVCLTIHTSSPARRPARI